MLRALILWILLPAALLAQTPAPKTAAPAPKPAPAPRRAPAPPPAVPKTTTAVKTPAPAAAAPMTDEENTVYALGLLVQRSLRQFDLTASELEILKRALTDAAASKPAVELTQWGPRVDPLARARAARVAAREKAAGAAYVGGFVLSAPPPKPTRAKARLPAAKAKAAPRKAAVKKPVEVSRKTSAAQRKRARR